MMLQTAWELLLQVTLWSTVGIALLFAVNRWWPERLANLAWRFLLGIIVLTVLVWIPWPRWMAGGLSVAEHTSVPSQTGDAGPVTSTSQGMSFSHAWQTWQKWVPAIPTGRATPSTASRLFTWPIAFGILAVAGMCLGLWRLLVSYRFVRAQLEASDVISDLLLLEQCNQLVGKLGIQKSVELRASPILYVAATVGTWQPVILLPHNWATWSEAECRTVLAHELAHIQRSDYLMMVLTQIIAIVYWFHPLVGWLSRYMRAGQELAADALAVHVLGDRTSYLQCLARLALVQDGVRLPAPARLFLSPEVSLLRRIAMLREGSRGVLGQRRLLRWGLAVAVMITGIFVASVRSNVLANEARCDNTQLLVNQSWQRYIAGDGPGFVVLQPLACLNLESMRKHRELLNGIMLNDFKIGVPLDSIECFMGNLYVKPRVNGEVHTGRADYYITYFRFTTSEATESFLKHYLEGYQVVDRPDGRCLKSTGKSKFNNVEFFLRPDERTLVFPSSTEELDRWLATAKIPVGKPRWLKAWPLSSTLAFMALNMKCESIQTTIQQVGTDSPIFPMIKPLLPELLAVYSSVTTEDRPSVTTKLYCTTQEAAHKSLTQVQAVIGLTKLLQVSGATGSTPVKENPEHQRLVALLNSLKTQCIQDEVVIELQSPTTLGDLFSIPVAEIKKDMEKSKLNAEIEVKK